MSKYALFGGIQLSPPEPTLGMDLSITESGTTGCCRSPGVTQQEAAGTTYEVSDLDLIKSLELTSISKISRGVKCTIKKQRQIQNMEHSRRH